MSPSVIEHFDAIPPNIARFLARDNGRKLTTVEIARLAKMSTWTVGFYSKKKSWKTIPVGAAERYAKACGLDLLRPRRSLQFLSRFIKTGKGLVHLDKRDRIRFSKILSES